MSQYNGVTELTGLFQEVYGDDIMNLIPESGKLVKMLPFVSKDKQEGNKYHQPVIVSTEHGFTYNTTSLTAFALNNHIAGTMQDAQVQGSEILLRSALGYRAAAKAAKGKRAFKEATELLVDNMLESMTKRLEISMLYGQKGIGSAASSVNTNSTTTVLQISTASWASGIWSGIENAVIQLYKGSDGTLISSGTDAQFTVSVVDVTNKKVTVTGSTTGISALDTALGSTTGDIYFLGSKGEEMYGIDYILQNTGSLFNVDASVYGLWQANTSDASSAQLTMSKILKAISVAVGRGLNEKVTALMSPETWQNVASDLAAFRKFDGSYSRNKGENGFESISFYGQNGEIELVGYNLVKQGDCFLLPMKKVRRLGASEITFKTPGREDEIFLQLPSNAGFELRCYADQAILIETPARAVKIKSIVNV